MHLPVTGQRISRVAFDQGISFLTEDGFELRIEGVLDLEVDGMTHSGVDPSQAAEHAGALVARLGQALILARVWQDGGLEIRVGGNLVIRVPHDEDFEAWSYAGADGGRAVSGPGGEVSTWGPLDWR